MTVTKFKRFNGGSYGLGIRVFPPHREYFVNQEVRSVMVINVALIFGYIEFKFIGRVLEVLQYPKTDDKFSDI